MSKLDCTVDVEFSSPDAKVYLRTEFRLTFKIHEDLVHGNLPKLGILLDGVRRDRSGVKIVNVRDAPSELRIVLRALYKPMVFFASNRRWMFMEAAALVKLGHKYGAEDYVQQGMRRIESFYTDQLEVWNRTLSTVPRSTPEIICAPEDAILAFVLGRLTGRNSVLPLAMYLAAQLSTTEIMMGVRGRGADHFKNVDVIKCLNTCMNVTGATKDSLATVFRYEDNAVEVGPHCITPTSCNLFWRAMFSSIPSTQSDIITILAKIPTKVSQAVPSFCDRCREALPRRAMDEQRRLWVGLRDMTGLVTDVGVWAAQGNVPNFGGW